MPAVWFWKGAGCVFMTDVQTSSQPEVSDEYLLRDRKLHAIVPRTSVAGNTLTLVIGIMSFLASLTLGAVSLVNDTATGWQSDIAREVTIQVKPVEGEEMQANLVKAIELVSEFEGVDNVTLLDEAATQRLLEPWLGTGFDMNELPVPRILSVTVDETSPPDFAAIQTKLDAQIAGASLDDHRTWVDRLNTMARATIISGIVIFALMMAATILTVVFATRGAMAGNRHVIEVLHFVGADQGYIAGEFQRHFLLLGLKGGLVGGIAAVIVFVLIGWWATENIADPSADQVSALFGTFSVGLDGYLGTVLLVFLVGILTALTSRFTVLRHVETLDRMQGN